MALKRNKKSKKIKVDKKNLGIGSTAAPKKSEGFGGAFDLSDVASEQDLKRKRKGASQMTLGAKYGGRRKYFAALALSLIAALVMSALALFAVNSKPGQDDIDAMVREAVDSTSAENFPVGDAGVWVEQFIRTWGTWDATTVAGRESALSPFLAPGMDSSAGWNGQGTQQVIYTAVSSQPRIIDPSRAIFSATYQIQDGTWRCVEVPVFAYQPQSATEGPEDQWGFAATANPIPAPCSLTVTVPAYRANDFDDIDRDAAESLRQQFFPGFFTAWVTSDSDTLQQYVSPSVTTFGLGGAYTSNVTINEVILPVDAEDDGSAQSGKRYSAYVSVTLEDRGGASVTATYIVPVSATDTQWQVVGEPEPVVQDLTVTGGSRQGEGAQVEEEQRQNFDPGEQPAPEQPEDSELTVPTTDAPSTEPAEPTEEATEEESEAPAEETEETPVEESSEEETADGA